MILFDLGLGQCIGTFGLRLRVSVARGRGCVWLVNSVVAF